MKNQLMESKYIVHSVRGLICVFKLGVVFLISMMRTVDTSMKLIKAILVPGVLQFVVNYMPSKKFLSAKAAIESLIRPLTSHSASRFAIFLMIDWSTLITFTLWNRKSSWIREDSNIFWDLVSFSAVCRALMTAQLSMNGFIVMWNNGLHSGLAEDWACRLKEDVEESFIRCQLPSRLLNYKRQVYAEKALQYSSSQIKRKFLVLLTLRILNARD